MWSPCLNMGSQHLGSCIKNSPWVSSPTSPISRNFREKCPKTSRSNRPVALPQLSGGGHSIGPPVRIKLERFSARLAPSRTNSPTGGSKRAPGRREEPPGPSSHRSSVRFSEAGSTRPASASSRAPKRAPWALKWRGPSPEGLAPRWADTAHLELGQPVGSRCPDPEVHTVMASSMPAGCSGRYPSLLLTSSDPEVSPCRSFARSQGL